MGGKGILNLKQGESYRWLCFANVGLYIAATMVSVATKNFIWCAMTIHVCILYLVVCEVWSRVALDSWWVASYLQGTWQYRAMLAWHFAIAILALIVALAFAFSS
jgi:hypothetical protein